MPTDLTPQDFEEMASKAVKNAESSSKTTSGKTTSAQEDKEETLQLTKVGCLVSEAVQNCSQETQSEVARELEKLRKEIFSED